MDEYSYPVLLCEYLNNMDTDTVFVPETWRGGAACVMLSGGEDTEREYIDGSARIKVPFEIRLRCSHKSVRERLDAVDFFTAVNAYVRDNPVPLDGGEYGRVSPVGGTFKSAIYENGEEEYRAAYSFGYYRKAQ